MDEQSKRLARLGCLRQALFMRGKLSASMVASSERIAYLAASEDNINVRLSSLDQLSRDVRLDLDTRNAHSQICIEIEIIENDRKAGRSNG